MKKPFSILLVMIFLSMMFTPILHSNNSSRDIPIIQISKLSWNPSPFNRTAGIQLSIIYAENVRAYAVGIEISLPNGIHNSTGGTEIFKCIPITSTQGDINVNFTVNIGNVSSRTLLFEENQSWFLDNNVSMIYNVSDNLTLTYLGDPVPYVTLRNQTLVIENLGTAPLYNITLQSRNLDYKIPYLSEGRNYSINLDLSYPEYNFMFSVITPYHQLRSWNESFTLPLKFNVKVTASTMSSLYNLLPGYNLIKLHITSNPFENMTVIISSSDAFVSPNYVQVRGNSTVIINVLPIGSISSIQVDVDYLGRQVYSSNFTWIVSQASQFNVPFKVNSKVVGNEVETSVYGSFATNVSLYYHDLLIHYGVPPFNVSFPFRGSGNVTLIYQVNSSMYRVNFPIQDVPPTVSFPLLKVIDIQKQVVSSNEIVLLVGIYNNGNSSAYDVDVVGSSLEQSSPSPVEVESQIQPNETVFIPVYIYGNSYFYNITIKIFYSSQGKPQVITKDIMLSVPSKPTPAGEIISALSISYDGIPLLFIIPIAVFFMVILLPRKKN